MQVRCAHETSVLMVPTPHPYATSPHAPADRAQSSSQTLQRPSRPLPQQASKITHPDDDMWEEQMKLLLSRASVETTLKVFDANACELSTQNLQGGIRPRCLLNKTTRFNEPGPVIKLERFHRRCSRLSSTPPRARILQTGCHDPCL